MRHVWFNFNLPNCVGSIASRNCQKLGDSILSFGFISFIEKRKVGNYHFNDDVRSVLVTFYLYFLKKCAVYFALGTNRYCMFLAVFSGRVVTVKIFALI